MVCSAERQTINIKGVYKNVIGHAKGFYKNTKTSVYYKETNIKI